ncbi:MAG TPA: hypothetical protein VG649_10495, partial [Candidatus Angelobacter sp.]|nr:hypothetical protein [Candidatus Angelobacter sp.]
SYRHRAPERIRTAYNWERITDQYEELFYQLATGEDPTRVHSSVASPLSPDEAETSASQKAVPENTLR